MRINGSFGCISNHLLTTFEANQIDVMPDKLTLQDVLAMDFPPVILYAIPVMLSLVLLEWYIGYRQNKHLYDGKDLLASAAIGIGNLIISAFLKTATLIAFIWVYNLSPIRIPFTWWSFILCIFAIDFSRYWAHRLAHEWQWLWATHVTHHSSEHYNFAVSFRLSWTQHIKIIFYLPLALFGFHPVVFFIANQIEVLYQFWIHTELIRKLPRPIEYFFTTPSHHRVHHAVDAEYIDKNYGSTFIIWDRMFGTFQEEKHQPTYGITKPVNSYNPLTLNFHVWGDLFRELRQARSLKDVWQITFGYPGTWKKRAASEAAPSGNDPQKS